MKSTATHSNVDAKQKCAEGFVAIKMKISLYSIIFFCDRVLLRRSMKYLYTAGQNVEM